MLEIVKRKITEPVAPFNQFYQQYILDVQDSSIESEVSFAIRNNFLDISALNRIMNSVIEEMK